MKLFFRRVWTAGGEVKTRDEVENEVWRNGIRSLLFLFDQMVIAKEYQLLCKESSNTANSKCKFRMLEEYLYFAGAFGKIRWTKVFTIMGIKLVTETEKQGKIEKESRLASHEFFLANFPSAGIVTMLQTSFYKLEIAEKIEILFLWKQIPSPEAIFLFVWV